MLKQHQPGTTGVRTHKKKANNPLKPMSEHDQCCICLDQLRRPASLPCGHRFCLGCIGEFWRIHGAYLCPLCKASYSTRPQLQMDKTLHTLSEDIEDATRPFKSGEVLCDFCQAKRRAVKSCLVCMASFCASHLEPHYKDEDLGHHHLISVVKNMEDSVCGVHGKQLSRFCRSDQTCICAMCAQTEHRGHHIISIHREATKKKVKLRLRRIQLQQAIQERVNKVEKTKQSSDISEENPKEARAKNKELIIQLEEEISELQLRYTELEQLSQTEDNLRFLQRFLHRSST
ncbi:E3 ubiquitin/ISG15 ligase TRIM25-like [Cheilinus undulatus]|uniref:E3 ubiquitin/ISG15 ligase TRIM25-like n=1 Tax=Cheilinus undulatus TaxID=241271 RepID=UPI001BD53434|nr:E3 ubiquitin/ISG15 ligase TRIM25-like [Cheilinus undulatus]